MGGKWGTSVITSTIIFFLIHSTLNNWCGSFFIVRYLNLGRDYILSMLNHSVLSDLEQYYRNEVIPTQPV